MIMMSASKEFIRGEKVAAGQSKKRGQASKQQDSSKPRQKSNVERRDKFKRRPRDRSHDRFTTLIKTPKEILVIKSGKGTFVAPPHMSGVPKARNKNKYCDFHEDKGHNTKCCLQLRIGKSKEAINSGQLAHLMKEIKKGNTKASTCKVLKKPDQAPKIKESPSSWSTPGKECMSPIRDESTSLDGHLLSLAHRRKP
ncbi:hypothetical protein Tco_1409045 [Tanacetum coccineum]